MCKRAGIELDDFEALFGENSGGINEMMPSTKKRDKSQYPIADIKIDMIDGFPNHPFRVVDDEEMAQLIENISEYGVMHPVIVRKVGDRYQMISGHRRLFASKKANKETIPARIMELSDDDAAIIMADANFLQRTEIRVGNDFYILPSSVHEVLIVPKEAGMDFKDLEAMVQEVNATQVAPQDKLSDHVYQYDIETREVFRADRAEEHQQKKEVAKDAVDMPKDAVADKPKDKGDKEKTSLKERLEDKKKESKEMEKKSPENLTQKGREEGIRRLMSINLLKRLESSVYSFNLTLSRIRDLITNTISAIDRFEKYGNADIDMYEAAEDEFDMDDGNTDYFTVGKKVKIDLADMDYKSWRDELKADAEVLELLTLMVADITPEYDTKLQTLFDLISKKVENPINEGNKKILIFSAFSDTADYLYENVSTFVKKKYGLDTAIITGTTDGKSTIKGLKATLNNVLTCFWKNDYNKYQELFVELRTRRFTVQESTSRQSAVRM